MHLFNLWGMVRTSRALKLSDGVPEATVAGSLTEAASGTPRQRLAISPRVG